MRKLVIFVLTLIVLALLCLPHVVHAQPITITQPPGVQTVENSGTALTRRRTLNFSGNSVTCTDDAGGNETDCFVEPTGVRYASNSNFAAYSAVLDATAGNLTVTLFNPPTTGTSIHFVRADSSANTVTIQRTMPDTIDGGASITLVPGEARTLIGPSSGAWRTGLYGRNDGAAIGLRETTGPTVLTMGAVADGEYLLRSGTTIVSGPGGAGGGAFTRYANVAALPAAVSNTGVLAVVDADNSWYYSDGASWMRQATFAPNGQSVTSTTTLVSTSATIDATSGNIILTLPVIPALGQFLFLSRQDAVVANTVTLTPSGGNTISGNPTASFPHRAWVAIVAAPGATDWVLAGFGPLYGPAASTVEVDFGASGDTNVTVVVTGANWVRSNSTVICSPTTSATADRLAGAEDAVVEGLVAATGQVVAGTGFTLYVATRLKKAYGKFLFNCHGAAI